jgi:SAM-dependent methyltransferase
MLWTRVAHRDEVHQTTPFTCEERYPALFDLAATLAPDATRILSFGCSTGEELAALRRRFPRAEIVGAEINPRSRRIAARRVASDPDAVVVRPHAVQGSFDAIFALAVLQREPHKVAEMGVEDLSAYYPFYRFDAAVRALATALRPDGLFCVTNAHYRVEDSTVAAQFEPVSTSPLMDRAVYAPNGRLIDSPHAYTMFRKRDRRPSPADHGEI